MTESVGGFLLQPVKFWQTIIFFFFTFLWSGITSVVAQMFFLRFYPEQKSTYLSLLLMTATCLSVGAIQISHFFSRWYSANFHKLGLLYSFGIFLIAILAALLFSVNDLSLFVILTLSLCVAYNLYENVTDQFYVASSPTSSLGQYNQTVLGIRLLAWMLSPLYFTNFYLTAINSYLIATFGFIITVVFFLSTLTSKDSVVAVEAAYRKTKAMNLSDLAFFLYAFSVMGGATLFITMQIYIIKDFFKLPNAEKLGGIYIALCNVFAVIAVFGSYFYRTKSKSRSSDTNKRNIHFKFNFIRASLIPMSYIALMLLLKNKVFSTEWELAGVAVVGGFVVGFFLDQTRNYATLCASVGLRKRVLTLFNNQFNISALIAFVSIFVMTRLENYLNIDFYHLLFIAVCFWQIAGLLSLVFFRTQEKKIIKKTYS